ncbi:hypothetical protein ACFS2C_17300 [Prauserella oleivorans]|uniref:Uncharacterized protein n=1 Tax=Prauserella oleivorans TaxID=1478153 RepID=A0ABW5WBR2_9PSEU
MASQQDLANAFRDDRVVPTEIRFGDFVDRRYAADLDPLTKEK